MTRLDTYERLIEMKKAGEKIACLTAYDAGFSRLMERQGIDMILVGDSLGMVLQGGTDTLQVSMDNMVYHTHMVRQGITGTLLVADLPYHSYENPDSALLNGRRLLAEGSADMVKLEGGREIMPQLEALCQHDIPVCGHLGLQPQSVHKYGGYKVQGRDQKQAKIIMEDAVALQQAGVKMIVLECIPHKLATEISRTLEIPVIGIGAGGDCDGQVLVIYDVIGISGYIPKMANDFLKGHDGIGDAIGAYIAAVKDGTFPTLAQSFE